MLSSTLQIMTYAPAKFEVTTSNSIGEDPFTRKNILWPWGQGHTKCDQYHPHHVTYAPANFEVAMSNGLEDAFTRKYIIWPRLQGQGHMKCCLVPSTSCDLCICKIWSCYFQVYEEMCLQENTLFDLWPWPRGQGHMKHHKYLLHQVIYACTRLKLLRPKFRKR